LILYVGLSGGGALALGKNGMLSPQPVPVKWANSNDLLAMTTVSTNKPRLVAGRIEFAAKKFGWS
jgi:hypothetical protein